MINDALPPMPFPFTVDLLKDSLRIYQSPYGQIADTEQIVFPKCDCWDSKRNKPARHNPCKKAAIVVNKSIYTVDEAMRREIEESEYLSIFSTIENEIRIWVATDEGVRATLAEVRKRQGSLREEISLRKEMITSQQLKHKKARDNLNAVTKRKVKIAFFYRSYLRFLLICNIIPYGFFIDFVFFVFVNYIDKKCTILSHFRNSLKVEWQLSIMGFKIWVQLRRPTT